MASFHANGCDVQIIGGSGPEADGSAPDEYHGTGPNGESVRIFPYRQPAAPRLAAPAGVAPAPAAVMPSPGAASDEVTALRIEVAMLRAEVAALRAASHFAPAPLASVPAEGTGRTSEADRFALLEVDGPPKEQPAQEVRLVRPSLFRRG